MAVQRLDSPFAIQTLKIEENIKWWRQSDDKVWQATWELFAVLAGVAIIIGGVYLFKSLKYKDEIITWTNKQGEIFERKVSVLADWHERGKCVAGLFLVTPFVAPLLGGAVVGIIPTGFFWLIRTGVGSLGVSSWETYRESFRHDQQVALNSDQLRRLIQDAPHEARPAILQRCVTQAELDVFQEVVGRDQTIAIASQLPDYQAIAPLFVGDWKVHLKAFDYRTLRDSPVKRLLFFHLVKGMPIGQRFLVAKWLFANGANLFNRPQVQRSIEPAEFQDVENIQLDLAEWKHSSSFLIDGCKAELVKGHPVGTLKERLLFIFSLSRDGMQLQQINHLLDVVFDEIEPDDNIRNLLITAQGYMEGYFDQALLHMIRDEEFEQYHIQKPLL
jgi:hypothetical protein